MFVLEAHGRARRDDRTDCAEKTDTEEKDADTAGSAGPSVDRLLYHLITS